VGPLSGLTSLTSINLRGNSVTDLEPLSGRTGLTLLNLRGNGDLADIQVLLDNTGLGTGDEVNLSDTNVSCTDVTALRAKGVTVISACP
jgi:hypothetical protein